MARAGNRAGSAALLMHVGRTEARVFLIERALQPVEFDLLVRVEGAGGPLRVELLPPLALPILRLCRWGEARDTVSALERRRELR